MQLSNKCGNAQFFAVLTLFCAFAVGASAQDTQSIPPAPSASQPPATAAPQAFKVGEYSTGRSHFPNPIAPYAGKKVPLPSLTNTPRLEQLFQNGKLMLSMNDAIALALENNLDIAISRYNLNIADTDVLRTKAGATVLGVNTGVVQGTPGGGVGGFGGATTATGGAGGTTQGSGGAGGGTLGIVSSTLGLGSPITSYDPILTGTLQIDRFSQEPTNPFSGNVPILFQNTSTANFAYRLQIITTVDQIQNMYWDLVNAYENVKVQQDALALANKTLSDNKKQVEIGTLAPIEVVRAESTVATDQQQLTVAQTNLELQQLLVKNALSRTLVDPALADADVIPTDTMLLPEVEPVVPTQDLVDSALSRRPELAEARMNLHNTAISNKAIRNNLLPSLD